MRHDSIVLDEAIESGSTNVPRAILSGPARSGNFPDWFHDQQAAAWKQFQALPNPTRNDPAWRFSNVGVLALAPFKLGGALPGKDRNAILVPSRAPANVAARVLLAG